MSQIDSVVSQLQAERENLLDSFSRIDHVLKPLSNSVSRRPSKDCSGSEAALAEAGEGEEALGYPVKRDIYGHQEGVSEEAST
jgi:hypothetical protein